MSITNYILEKDLFAKRTKNNDYLALALHCVNAVADVEHNDLSGHQLVDVFMGLSSDQKATVNDQFNSAIQSDKLTRLKHFKEASSQALSQHLGSTYQQINTLSTILFLQNALLQALFKNQGLDYQASITALMADSNIDLDMQLITDKFNFLNEFHYQFNADIKRKIRAGTLPENWQDDFRQQLKKYELAEKPDYKQW